VFARPTLGAIVHPSFDELREWFLPVSLERGRLNILGAWAMNQRGMEVGPKRGRIQRTVAHYEAFLGGGRSILMGDLNNNVTWDTPRFPEYADLVAILARFGLANVYHARTGESAGYESVATLFQYRHLGHPYFVDHAFVPDAWLPFVTGFAIGRPDDWLEVSDHMPLVLDLGLHH
jgi:hypothetical protein